MEMRSMQHYEAQDFPRCAGNPCFSYCKDCKRNVINSPINPKAQGQWWMGPWIIEDEKCPSFKKSEGE